MNAPEHEKFMRQAILLASQGVREDKGGPFGAVIVKDGAIIGQGHNCVTSTYDPTAHAEIVAIRQACQTIHNFSLKGAVIYTSCEPCPMCLAALYWSRIDMIYFANSAADAAAIGFDDAFFYRELQMPASKRSMQMKQLMRTEALFTFRLWQEKEDKTPY